MRNKSSGFSFVIIVVVVVLVIAGGLYWRHVAMAAAQADGGSGAGSAGGKKGMNGGLMPVQVRQVGTGDIHVYLNGLGTVTPANSVTVHSRVDGQLMAVNFKEGQTVRAGELLAQIDPRPYQVALTQAQGQLAKDQAALAGARLDQVRYQGLLAQDSISKQQVDSQNALVLQDDGAVKADQGAVDSARLNLVYARVTAPVSGEVGLRQVDPGNIVHAADTNGLVIINQVEPIYVLFTIPEDSVPDIALRVHQGQTLDVEAWDREQKNKLTTGHLQSMDNQVDTTTGTVKLKAVFDNKDGLLFPNQFVNAHLLVETRRNVPVIPSAGVQRGTSGVFVFVVDSTQHVSARTITIGPVDGDNVQVLSGLQPGETVVIDGADKLKDGGKVSVVTPQAPGAAPQAQKGSGQHHHHSDAAQ
jgi:multidrug efflux system membrane fusion protein